MRRYVLAGALSLAGCVPPIAEKPIFYEPCSCKTINRPDSISAVALWWDDASSGPFIIYRGNHLPLAATATAKEPPGESKAETNPREVRLTYPPRDAAKKR